jgi:uncharacterized protein (DUF983 family)
MSPTVLVRRGLIKRCPVCGGGHLFRHWVSMAEDCPQCGLHFYRAPGQWMGSWFINLCVDQAAIVIVIVVGVALTYPNPNMWVMGGLGAVIAVGLPFVFFPFSRTIWTALDLIAHPLDLDDGVAPGFELDFDHQPEAGPAR